MHTVAPRPRLAPLLATLLALVSALALVQPSPCWGPRCRDINDFRQDHTRPGLQQRHHLQAAADTYAHTLATTGVLVHDPAWAAGQLVGGEIVGYAPDWATVLQAWKDSPDHRALLLDRSFTRVGIGWERDPTGRLWAVVRFR